MATAEINERACSLAAWRSVGARLNTATTAKSCAGVNTRQLLDQSISFLQKCKYKKCHQPDPRRLLQQNKVGGKQGVTGDSENQLRIKLRKRERKSSADLTSSLPRRMVARAWSTC